MLEAAAADMGIIITETGVVEELLISDDFVIVLEDDSPDALANAILKFYNDRGFLERCGANVATRVRENFTWNKAVQELPGLFYLNTEDAPSQQCAILRYLYAARPHFQTY